MNISLRKANAVQAGINDAIKGIKIETTLELNEFQDVVAELKKANDALFTNDSRRQRLLLALFRTSSTFWNSLISTVRLTLIFLTAS